MTHLYELSGAMVALNSMDEDQSVIDTLEGIEMEFNQKAENIALYQANIDGDIEKIDQEIKRLQQRKTILKNKGSSLKDYLRENMERTGITKIACPLFTITLAKGRDMVEIIDEDELPDDYVRIKSQIVPDKDLILKKLKDGESIAGAKLTKSKTSIRIK